MDLFPADKGGEKSGEGRRSAEGGGVYVSVCVCEWGQVGGLGR